MAAGVVPGPRFDVVNERVCAGCRHLEGNHMSMDPSPCGNAGCSCPAFVPWPERDGVVTGQKDAARASDAGLTHRRRAASARQELLSESIVHGGAGAINQVPGDAVTYRAALLTPAGSAAVLSEPCADAATAEARGRLFLASARRTGKVGARVVIEQVTTRRVGELE